MGITEGEKGKDYVFKTIMTNNLSKLPDTKPQIQNAQRIDNDVFKIMKEQNI